MSLLCQFGPEGGERYLGLVRAKKEGTEEEGSEVVVTSPIVQN